MTTDSFEVWLKKVDREIKRMTLGMVGMYDLADWTYHDAYDSGMTPKEAAEEAVQNDDLGAEFLDEMGF